MTCPICGAETKIFDSRKHIDYVRRRRVCSECGYRFTTEEKEVEDKKYDKSRLYGSVRVAGSFTGNAKPISQSPFVGQ